MKLIPIGEMLRGPKILSARTQSCAARGFPGAIQRLSDCGAREVRVARGLPPASVNCKFLNVARWRSELDLATRKTMKELAISARAGPAESSPAGPNRAVVEHIRQMLRLTGSNTSA